MTSVTIQLPDELPSSLHRSPIELEIVTVPLLTGPTIYEHDGDLFAGFCVLAVLATLLATRLGRNGTILGDADSA